MCRIHQSSCTLCVCGGGGGHSSAFVEGAGHTFDTIFENFLCLLWEGGGGGEGDYWTSRYRLFNKFCHGFLSGLGYYLSIIYRTSAIVCNDVEIISRYTLLRIIKIM